MQEPTPIPDPAREFPRGQGCAGTAALVIGIGLVCLAVVEDAAGLPFRMPRSWYASRPLWFFLAFCCIIGGCVLLRGRRSDRQEAAFHRVVLYTRRGCHLCEEAMEVLLKYAEDLPEVEEVDIDGDPTLVQRYGEQVPVVEIDGVERFRGRVNEILLRRLIRGQRRDEQV